jgi:hypothetical protein
VQPLDIMALMHFATGLCRTVRGRMAGLIDQWSRICTIAERILKRSEASAVRKFELLTALRFIEDAELNPFLNDASVRLV